MAPDKIFLAFEHGFVAQASNIEKDANGNSIFLSEYNPVEYIRKGALLALLKTKLSHLQEDFDVYTGQRIILRELINEIESL